MSAPPRLLFAEPAFLFQREDIHEAPRRTPKVRTQGGGAKAETEVRTHQTPGPVEKQGPRGCRKPHDQAGMCPRHHVLLNFTQAAYTFELMVHSAVLKVSKAENQHG